VVTGFWFLTVLILGRSPKLAAPKEHDSSSATTPWASSKPQSHDLPSNGDAMHVDDTKTRVYITDLDQEIAEIEAQENNVEVLSTFEKELMGVPSSVLKARPSTGNELVLYRLPSALTVSKEQDSVRSVIAGARKRAREKSLLDAEQAEDETRAKREALQNYEDEQPEPSPWPIHPPDQPHGVYYDVEPMDLDD
jgi:hypothetical protein